MVSQHILNQQIYNVIKSNTSREYYNIKKVIDCSKMSRKSQKGGTLKLPVIQEVDETNQIFLKKQWFIQSKKEKILHRYAFANKIGEGAFGQVYKATLIGTDLVRAIKVIRKDKVVEPSRLVTEINLMKQLDHPNLIKLYQTYETDSQLYLVMEYCQGGQLFSRIQNGNKMSEKQVKQIFRDIAKAITYLHSCNVCHRDLKPQNFLFLDKKPGSTLKLIDFGLSTTVAVASKLKSMVGTVYYISPQVIDSKYDISCDVWSLGVILIVLLSGQAPFQGNQDHEIMDNIRQKNYIIPKDISATAKNLISRCLMPPEKRIKASQILQHPWLIDTQRRVTISQKMNINTMKNFSESNRLKKLVLTIIASQVKSKDVQDLAKLFKSLDLNNDGQLSRQQILNGLKKSHSDRFTQSDFLKIIQGIDTDKNGKISYTQFLAATMDQKIYLKPKYLRIAFDMLDKDKSGTIEFEQLKQILMQNQSINKIKQNQWLKMIKQIDKNGDNVISFEEFIQLFQTS